MKGEEPLPKTDPVIKSIYDWVMSEYDGGRITVISEDELAAKYNTLSRI